MDTTDSAVAKAMADTQNQQQNTPQPQNTVQPAGQVSPQQVPSANVQVPVQNAPQAPSIPQQPTSQEQPQPKADGPLGQMQELVDQVERDLLAHIYTNLKENKLTGIAAQELAKEFLGLLPFKDKKDLVDKLSTLGQKYPEARETYVNLGIPLEEQQRQERLDQMRAHIKLGDLDKALEVAKGGTPDGGGGK